MRIGMGCRTGSYFKEAELFLGGMAVSRKTEVDKSSEIDLLTYAIMDALLGAAALGNVERQFVETDPDYKEREELELLERVGELLEERLYVISNIDAAIIAPGLNISCYIESIQKNIAQALHIRVDQVNIKKMQTGLGMISAEGQVAAQAIVSLDSIENFSYSVDMPSAERNCSGCHGCARS
ncbi:MAG: 2-C-methyl-D-erythritol 2,4-cyclodiphosphate synthase [Eubacteriales bacterium]|nr:2-C-methyl-D-erythritol 2,4-cyclodiphosphate synthase [Eubacteriales bacterium]